jgi:penicillin-insensitive murein endopeptidase
MMIKRYLLLASVAGLTAGAFSCATIKLPSPEFAKWAAVQTPSTGDTQIYGTYQAGCIAGAKALPLNGEGYYVVHQERSRYYGHPSMIGYLTALAKKVKQKKYPNMVVEDISYPRGGPFLTGHNSHQVGLDVDISLTSAHLPITADQGLHWGPPSFVEDRKTLLKTWSKEQVQLIQLAADFPEVNRIFVAPAIKKYFCENFKDQPWLYKLRSWWGHDDHIHVRLNCPAEMTNCKSQPPLDPASTSACGSELEWWYSAEADAEAKKQDEEKAPREFPVLPAQCEYVRDAN